MHYPLKTEPDMDVVKEMTMESNLYKFFNYNALGRLYFYPSQCLKGNKRLSYGLSPRDKYTIMIEK